MIPSYNQTMHSFIGLNFVTYSENNTHMTRSTFISNPHFRSALTVDHGLFMSESLIRKDYLLNGNNRLISCYEPEYNYQSFSIIDENAIERARQSAMISTI